MSWRRGLLTLLGLGVLGLAVAVGRGVIGGVLPVDAVLGIVGNDYFVVAGLAGTALLVAVPALASGRASRIRHVEMPDPEGSIQLPTPGDGIDDTIGGWRTFLPLVGRRRRRRVQHRLREAAISVVGRVDNCSRSVAERRVNAGEWTADPVARAVVQDPSRDRLPLDRRLRALLGGETGLQWQVRRTVEAMDTYRDRR